MFGMDRIWKDNFINKVANLMHGIENYFNLGRSKENFCFLLSYFVS